MEKLHFAQEQRDTTDPDVRILSDDDLDNAVKEGTGARP
jgi:hypothetical protein